MRNFTKIDKDNVLINTLFIQPTTLCDLNCKGCYVKEWGASTGSPSSSSRTLYVPENHLSSIVWYELFHIFSSNRNYDCYGRVETNQITLAHDVLPQEPVSRQYVANISREFLRVASENSRNKNTEFHMTAHSIADIAVYNEAFSCINMISLSTITLDDLDNIALLRETAPQTAINWNLQVYKEIKNEEAYIKKIITIAKHVDTIYLIIHKPDLGLKLDPKISVQYFRLYSAIRTELAKAGQDPNKVQIDGCVHDAKQFSEGIIGGCSSNISRFQIWPNGSVSGCPYTHKPTTDPVHTPASVNNAVIGILENIREAAKIYQFNSCKIPESLYSKAKPIINRNYRSLKIFED